MENPNSVNVREEERRAKLIDVEINHKCVETIEVLPKSEMIW